MTGEVVYVYVGDGSALPGLPARDVSMKEVEASGYSVEEVKASGLYVAAGRVDVKLTFKNKEK